MIRKQPLVRDLLFIALAAFILYMALAAARPQGIFWSLDEGGKWIYIESVLRTGNPQTPLVYPGKPLDSNYQNTALFFFYQKGDAIYSWWPVGFPLVTLPFYRMLGWAGLFIIPALAGAVLVYFSGLLTRVIVGQSRLPAALAAAVVALGTPVLYYSTTFWEHTLAAALVIASAYCLLASTSAADWRRRLVLAGVLGSLSIFFRQESALIMAGFGLVFLTCSPRRAVLFAAAGAVTSLAWIGFNVFITGQPLGPTTNATGSIQTFNGLASAGLKFIPYTLFNAPTVGAFPLSKYVLAAGSIITASAFLFGLWKRTLWVSAVFLFLTTLISAYVLFQPALYRSVHGFVLICPLVVVCSWVYPTQAWARAKLAWHMFLAAILFFMVGFLLKAWVAAGGLQWGPRYMLALYPLLMIAVITGTWYVITSLKTGWKRYLTAAVVCFALLIGLGYQIRGYISMNITMTMYEKSAVSLRMMKDEIIITECIWMPMVIPDLYWNGNIFTNEPTDLFIQHLKEAGRTHYLSVTMKSCSADPLNNALPFYNAQQDGLEIVRKQILP